MKLDKIFREQHHEHRGIPDRVDYILTQKLRVGDRIIPEGSTFLSIGKAEKGGWAFLGRHFNSIQGAKKEARRYCNQKAAELAGR